MAILIRFIHPVTGYFDLKAQAIIAQNSNLVGGG